MVVKILEVLNRVLRYLSNSMGKFSDDVFVHLISIVVTGMTRAPLVKFFWHNFETGSDSNRLSSNASYLVAGY